MLDRKRKGNGLELFGNLVHLKKYFLRYKGTLALGFIFIILSNIGNVYIPLLVKGAFDELQKKLSTDIIVKNAILIALTSAFAGLFSFLIRQTIIVVSRKIEYDLRKDFWEHIQKLPMRFFQNNSTGNIMSHATNDINSVRSFVGPSVMYSVDNGVLFIMTLSILFSLSTKLTLYTLIPLPFMSLFVYLVMSKIHSRYTKIQEKFSELTTRAQENFSGIRVIKSYFRENYEIDQYSKISDEYFQRKMNLVKLQAFFHPIFFVIAGLAL